MNRRLAAAFALCVCSALTGCWGARHPIDCLDEARLRTEKPQVLIVDAETGEPIRDAAVWNCPDAPSFHHFGAILLDARWDTSSINHWCNYLVSHPGYETREVRRDYFTGTRGAEEMTGRACLRREPVDAIRLRRLPRAAEVPPLAPSPRQAFASPGIPWPTPYPPGLVVLEVAGYGDVIAPASGDFEALEDPRLVALTRRPGRRQSVGWLLADGRACTHRLRVVPDMRASRAEDVEACRSAGLKVVGWRRRSGYEILTVEVGVGRGAHRGVLDLARRAAARLPAGWMVAFECRDLSPEIEID